MDVLRLITAGSVDDGKSTLIGRLLYDSKVLLDDQLTAIERSSRKKGYDHLDLSLLTDGLKAEREQGITIDVAHIYFATLRRKFIIADTPGHVEYTRNMVTGASQAQLALILVDARKGVTEQTRRHYFIASLLGLTNIVVAINKMDLVAYDEAVFQQITDDFARLTQKINKSGKLVQTCTFIPVSALKGDNVVNASETMDWYTGKPLLTYLEDVPLNTRGAEIAARFPVQYVVRPQSEDFHDYRGYAGRVTSGTFKVGDPVTVFPSGQTSTVKSINTLNGDLGEVADQRSVTIQLTDDMDISRGDMIAGGSTLPEPTRELEAYLCWMDHQALVNGGKYILRHTTRTTQAMVKAIEFRVSMETLEPEPASGNSLRLNDLGKIRLKTAQPLFVEPYFENPGTGAFILIDTQTNNTVAAGMISGPEAFWN